MRKGQYSYETHQALKLIEEGMIAAEAARTVGMSPASLYRVLGQIRREAARKQHEEAAGTS